MSHYPGAAYDAYVTTAVPASAAQPRWAPVDGPMPSVYLSHGAPPLFDDAAFLRQLGDWALSMPKPRAILVVSAHWEHAPLGLSSPEAAPTPVYDFGGFAPRYFEMRYDTPAAHDLAARVAAALPDATDLHTHGSRGLDHGAWVPLKAMYPLADVPTLQLSLPSAHPDDLLRLGRRLRPLREEGVLVIGSGFMTHGLPFLTREMVAANQAPGWSRDFDAWAADALARGDVDELAGYAGRAPGMPYAHPTVEHYLPVFVTLGAATDAAAVTTAVDGYMWGLSKRSFAVA